jgi:epoxyqueuosine reductase
MSSLAELVKQAALDEGFALAGIAPVAALGELDYFPAWIARGFHGEMEYLASRNDAGELRRACIANVAPWARSVVVCGANYNSDTPYSTACDDPAKGWISRYAFVHSDYHKLLLSRLRRIEQRMAECVVEHHPAAAQPTLRTWCYVDTGPVVERVLAAHSGIGWTGKNGCILNQQLGSWLFLGVILTSHPLPPDLPAPDRCGSCTRCIDACPTQALIAPRQLDPGRCISYLTIEQRGAAPEELRAKMGRHLFGCDICQDVCPWNRRAPVSLDAAFAPRTELVNPSLEWISGMNEEEFRRTFRASPVQRAKLRGLLRNAAIAMGNSGERKHLPRLRELAQQPDPVVAEHARWAIARLETTADADPTG